MKHESLLFRKGLYVTLSLVVGLWVIEGVEYALNVDFGILGIYPRTLKGSIGIITSPLIHDDLAHLLSNSFPLLFLGVAITFFYHRIANRLIVTLYLGTGTLVWLFGREAFHIGASGLVYGMIGFLLFSGIFRKEPQSMAISLAFLFLYGGVLQGVFPGAVKGNVSWESHLMGIVVGAVCAFYFRNQMGPKNLSKEDENDDNDGFVNFSGDADYSYFYKNKAYTPTMSPLFLLQSVICFLILILHQGPLLTTRPNFTHMLCQLRPPSQRYPG